MILRLYDDGELEKTIECETVEELNNETYHALQSGYTVEITDNDETVWTPH